MPQINSAGLSLIKTFEGCNLTAYPDPGTGGKPWTIGYGHTGPDVTPGETITQDQADAQLRSDLSYFQTAVNNMVARNLNPNQFAALVSFAYNVGVNALRGSTLLRLVNAGYFSGAAAQFGLWTHAAGQVLPGLVRRRTAEAALFMTPTKGTP
jgi:lysozyme